MCSHLGGKKYGNVVVATWQREAAGWLMLLHSFPSQKASRHNVLTRVVGTDEQEEFVEIKQPSGKKEGGILK